MLEKQGGSRYLPLYQGGNVLWVDQHSCGILAMEATLETAILQGIMGRRLQSKVRGYLVPYPCGSH